MSGTGAAPGTEPGAEVSQGAQAQESAAAKSLRRPPLPPTAGPVTEPPAESVLPQTRQSPAARLAMRAFSGDVMGSLVVKDRAAAEHALGDVLERVGGAVMSRLEETGTTLLEVTVPKVGYAQFTESLARIGTWKVDGPPSHVPSDVRMTIRLVE